MIAFMQEPPPYVQYAEEAAALARMTHAAAACDRLGYTISQEAGVAEMNAFGRRSEIDRVGSEFALRAYRSANQSERTSWERMLHAGDGLSQDEEDAALVDMMTFLVTRCREASRLYPRIVIADGDEPNTAVEAMDRLVAERQP